MKYFVKALNSVAGGVYTITSLLYKIPDDLTHAIANRLFTKCFLDLVCRIMKLYIKNMVCDRCIMVVKEQLNTVGLDYRNIQLGEVELKEEPAPGKLAEFDQLLSGLGFELLDDRKAAMVNQIKSTIIKLIHNSDNEELNKKTSVILSEKIGKDYHFLSGLFSATEGVTIEKYIILQRIERAKELIMYNELSLNEIADSLGYSSVQHLSQQFKKITGMTPSQFKLLKEDSQRKPLDKV